MGCGNCRKYHKGEGSWAITNCLDFSEDKQQSIIVKLQTENERLKGLLGVAICPNAINGCKDGILINPYGEPGPCQWCGMTNQALTTPLRGPDSGASGLDEEKGMKNKKDKEVQTAVKKVILAAIELTKVAEQRQDELEAKKPKEHREQ